MGGSSSKKRAASAPQVKNSRVTEQDKAILQLKQMRDKLKQYKNRIEIKLENERQLAKQLIKEGKTEKAKLLLKKKKFYENNLAKTDGQLDNIDQLVHNLEYTQIEHQVVNGLKIGNECLKKLHEMMSLDEIEDIMDDTRDAIEHQRKIDELISGQIDDDMMDEINAELEAIVSTTLPEVPDHDLPIPEQKVTDKKEPVREKSKKTAVLAE